MPKYSDQDFAGRYAAQVADIRTTYAALPAESTNAILAAWEDLPERLDRLLDEVIVVAASIDPLIAPPSNLGTITELMNRIKASLDQLIQIPGHQPGIQELITHIDQLAGALFTAPSWPSGPEGSWKGAVSDAAATLRRSFGQQAQGLRSELDGISAQSAALAQTLEAIRAQATSQIETMQADLDRRVAAIEASSTALTTQATENIQRLDEAAARSQSQYAAFQQQKSTQFDAALAEMQAAAKAELDALSNTSKSTLLTLKADADELRKALEDQVAKAKEMVSVFAGAGTGFAFGKEAAYQEKIANRWRVGAVTLTLAAIGAGLAVIFVAASSTSGRIYEAIGKVLVGLALLGAASYSAQQSARHRRREENARRAELRLVTLEPLIQNLDDVAKDKARQEAIQSLWAEPEHDHSPDATPAITSEQVSLLQTLVKVIFSGGK